MSSTPKRHSRNLLEALQLAFLGLLMFVAAAVAERRLARLIDVASPAGGRAAPA
jgi:hypothetical protein